MYDEKATEAVYAHDKPDTDEVNNVNSADTKLSNAIDALQNAVIALREKLSNILVSEDADVLATLQEVPAKSYASTVRVWIYNRTEAVNSVRRDIEDLIRRVDM